MESSNTKDMESLDTTKVSTWTRFDDFYKRVWLWFFTGWTTDLSTLLHSSSLFHALIFGKVDVDLGTRARLSRAMDPLPLKLMLAYAPSHGRMVAEHSHSSPVCGD